MQKNPIGIDVSMNTLDYYDLASPGTPVKGVIKNSICEIEDFLLPLDSSTVFLVVEPTGTYSDKLLSLIHI